MVNNDSALNEKHWRSPVDQAAEKIGDIFSTQLRESSQAADAIEFALRQLSERIRHWSIGEAASSHLVAVERLPRAEFSFSCALERVKRNSTPTAAAPHVFGVIPDAAAFALATHPLEDQGILKALGTSSPRMRAILPSSLPTESLDLLKLPFDHKVQVKFRSQPSPCFIVDSSGAVMILDHSGRGETTAVRVFHSQPVAGLATQLFSALWNTSYTVIHEDGPGLTTPRWWPLLSLLKQGLTLEVASRALKMSPRTGGRRVTEAMDYYNVTTLFALGRAWEEDALRQRNSEQGGATHDSPI